MIGLTSPANVAFCESLGCYDRVVTYDALDTIAAETPAVYVDFAGNGGLRNAIHARFANLKYSCSIGGTHVEQLAAQGAGKDLPGPRAPLFFAPAQIKKRTAEWHDFLATVTNAKTPWLRAEHHHGGEAVQAAYAQVLAGKGDPRIGHILSLYKQPGGL